MVEPAISDGRLPPMEETRAGRAARYLSIGKLVGEGFDHPPLDALVLAMPVFYWSPNCSRLGLMHDGPLTSMRR